MITLLSGPDTYRSFRRLTELIERRPHHRLELTPETAPVVAEALSQASLFGDSLIVITDEGIAGVDRRSLVPLLLRTDAEVIIREPTSQWSTLLTGVTDSLELFPNLTGQALVTVALALAATYEVTMAPGLVAELCRAVADPGALEALFATWSGQTITRELMTKEITSTDRRAVFVFLDSLFARQRRAIAQLVALRQSGEADNYLVSMIHWQLKTLLLVAAGSTGSLKPYTINKAKQLLRHWSMDELLQWSDRTVALDGQLKSGSTVAEVALDHFVLDLLTP